MAAEEKTIRLFRERLEDATKTPLEELLSKPMWGSINFEAARHDLSRALEMMGHLKVLPLEILPENTANGLSNQVESMRAQIDALRKFTLDAGGDPVGRRNGLVNEIRSNSDALFNSVQGFIPFLAYQKGDVAKNITELNSAITQAKGMLDKSKTDANETKGEIDKIIAAAREASASVGVAHFTTDFYTEASNLQKSAKYWLIATAILGAAALVAGMVMIVKYSNSGPAEAVAGAVPKIAILALLFTATLWCGRIYKAIMHQVVTNRHRGNALKTFQAFVKASADEKIRDAVLLETTRSIFAINPSGYIDTKTDHADSPTTVLELVRDSSRKGAA